MSPQPMPVDSRPGGQDCCGSSRRRCRQVRRCRARLPTWWSDRLLAGPRLARDLREVAGEALSGARAAAATSSSSSTSSASRRSTRRALASFSTWRALSSAPRKQIRPQDGRCAGCDHPTDRTLARLGRDACGDGQCWMWPPVQESLLGSRSKPVHKCTGAAPLVLPMVGVKAAAVGRMPVLA
jgi:hypothetical protein